MEKVVGKEERDFQIKMIIVGSLWLHKLMADGYRNLGCQERLRKQGQANKNLFREKNTLNHIFSMLTVHSFKTLWLLETVYILLPSER